MIHLEIRYENCGYCGCCVAVCQEHVLKLEENKISICEGCTECGNCSYVCPLGAIISGGKDE